MITEDYVSFETAKLLAEKGIEADCEYTGWIGESGSHYFPDDTYLDDDEMIAAHKDRKEFIPLISLQMAMKWLRENFNINPVPYALSLGWAFDIFDLSNKDITGCKKLFSMDLPSKSECYNTYEEACEAAIKYCLEKLV